MHSRGAPTRSGRAAAPMATPPERSFPFWADLSEAGRRELAALPMRRAGRRVQLLRRGGAVEGAYFVTTGALRVYYIAPDGREATLYWVEPGQTCVLALTAAFRSEPYPAWVETDDAATTLVVVPSATFRGLIDREPAVRELVFATLSGRVLDLMAALEAAGTLRVEQRVARLLLRRADADGVVATSQARLASHLGTAREVVFRALRSLSARGLVSTGRGSIHVLDRDGLVELASLEDPAGDD